MLLNNYENRKRYYVKEKTIIDVIENDATNNNYIRIIIMLHLKSKIYLINFVWHKTYTFS